MRESSPPDAVSATGPNGSPAFGRTAKLDLVRSGRALVGLAQLDPELALAEPDADELCRHGLGEARGGRPASVSELRVEAVDLGLCRRECLGGRASGIVSLRERIELGSGRGGAIEELRIGDRAVPAAKGRDPVEPGLDLLEPARIGLERIQEAAECRGDLTERVLRRTKRLTGSGQLGGEMLDRGDRPLGRRDEVGPGLLLLRGERRQSSRCALSELRHVAEPLPLGAQVVLVSRPEPGGVGDERAISSRRARAAAASLRELVVGAPGRLELPPGAAGRSGRVAGAGIGVEHRELVGRPREPTLLELPAHREQRLDGRGDILPGCGPPPGIGARAPVGEDAPRDHEASPRPPAGARPASPITSSSGRSNSAST